MAYGMKMAWLAVLAIVIAAISYSFIQHERIKDAQSELGIDSSRILTAVFSQSNELKVGRLRGAVLAKSECNSLDIFDNSQKVVAPYVVEYSVNLKRITQSDYRWNADDRILSIKIPDVDINAPSIDMARAQFTQSGLYISRACGIQMQRVAAARLSGAVTRKAEDEKNLSRVRESARQAVTNFVEGPLKAVGFGDVRVVVQLPGEQRPVALSREQWDISRSIAEVLADFR